MVITFLMFCHDGQVVDGILESVKGIIEYALVITNWLVTFLGFPDTGTVEDLSWCTKNGVAPLWAPVMD